MTAPNDDYIDPDIDFVDGPSPLISSAESLNEIYARAVQWQTVDKSLTATQRALGDAITQSRQALANASIAEVSAPGPPLASPSDVIAALNSSRAALQRALQARTQALQALDQARSNADAPLRQAADVLTARRAITAIIVLLFPVLFYLVMF